MNQITALTAAAVLAVSCFGAMSVHADGNYITNGDFSNGGLHWHGEERGAGYVTYENGLSRISSTGSDYEYRKYQTVEGLPNGTYTLTANAAVSDIDGIYYIYAKTEGHTMASTSIPQSSDLRKVTVPGIIVDNGKCDVGVFAKGSATVTLDDFVLTESSDTATRVPFLKGGEISKLTYIEDRGGKFYRADGTEADALQIMAENGFNLARIRVLNDPGKGHGADGYYLPAGYQTEEDCLELARRAKDKGMKIEFTFAYTDYWSDGDKQMIPHEWQEDIDKNNLTGIGKYEYLENKVYEYTKDIMQKLIAQGTCPDFVSIGNEMQGGLFFGNAKENGYKHENLYYTDWDWLVKFVNAGAKAVRETAPNAKVVIHSDNGGKAIKWTDTPFYYLQSHADFDVMAVSYYPFYNADISIDDVVAEFNKCITTFNKDVMIMETGYNWNEFKPDGWDGQLRNNGCYQDIYGETQNGQRAFLTELYSKLKDVAGGRCIADLYWDPVMIYDGGTGKIGWAINEMTDMTESNVVPNSTIFDFDGKAVAGQLAMKYNTNASDKLLITGEAEADKDIELKINGETVNTKADKFGDYIAAVDYPSGGKLEISANGDEESYIVDAPYDGVLVSGIDFNIVYSNEITSENGTVTANFKANTDSDDTLLCLLIKYDESGLITEVRNVFFKPNEQKSATAELAVKESDASVKSFLWHAKNLKPAVNADTVKIRD